MSIDIALEELIENTDAYKKNGIIYPHPRTLIEEIFLPHFKDIDYTVQDCRVDKEGGAGTKAPTEKDEDGNIKTYGRGMVIINTEIENNDYGLKQAFGVIWSYDTGKPMIKLFHGATVAACLNLSVMAETVKEFPINLKVKADASPKQREKAIKRKMEDIADLIDDTLDDWVANVNQLFNELVETITILDSIVVPLDTAIYDRERNFKLQTDVINKLTLEHAIGIMYLNDVIRGTFDYYTFNFALQILYDPKFMHFNKHLYYQNKDSMFTLWIWHNAMTQRFGDFKVDIDLVANKSADITKLLLNLRKYYYGTNEVTETMEAPSE